MPGDEGYQPRCRIAEYYERAGRGWSNREAKVSEGTITAIGALSPPGDTSNQ